MRIINELLYILALHKDVLHLFIRTKSMNFIRHAEGNGGGIRQRNPVVSRIRQFSK